MSSPNLRYAPLISLAASALAFGCFNPHEAPGDALEADGSTGALDDASTGDASADEDGSSDDGGGSESGDADGSSSESGDMGGCEPDCAPQWRELWSRIDGTDDYDEQAMDAAVDGAGNVLVVGTRGSGTGDALGYLEKYAPDGDLLWGLEHDVSGGRDLYTSVATDPSGEIVVAVSAADQRVAATRRYAPDGTGRWSHREPDGNLVDPSTAAAVAVAPDGTSLTVGGMVQQDGNAWWVARNSDGTVAFSHVSTVSGPDSAYRVAAAPAGGFVVLMVSNSTTALVRIDAAGTELWSAKLSEPYLGLGAHPDGDFFLAHTAQTTGSDGALETDVVVTRIDADGDTIWERAIDIGSDVELAYALTVDASGRLAITGTRESPTEGASAVTRVLDAEATVLWEQFDGDGPFNRDRGIGIAAGPEGQLAVAGLMEDETQDVDAWIAVFAP